MTWQWLKGDVLPVYSLVGRVPWTYMVVDEGHRLKNMNCRLLKEISFYKVQNKLLLTGTPLQNSLNELWSLLHFLMPSIFSDLESFHMWLDQNALMKQEQKREQKRQEQEGVKVKEEPESCEAAEQGSVKSEAEEREEQVLCMVQQILTPFVLRRVKKEVELELPQKRELLVFCPMSALQLNYYKVVSDRTIVSILGHSNHEVDHFDYEKLWRDYGRNRRYTADRVSGNAAKGDFTPLTTHRHSPLHARDDNDEMCRLFKNSKLTNFMALLKRVCNHPFLISNPHAIGDLNWYEDYLDTSGKMQLLDRMLEKLKQRGHKVLLFSQWTSILDIIEDSLSHRNYRYCRIDGNCSLADRQSQIDEFNNGHSDTSAKDHLFLFLLTTRAGGQGINLTAADTVIIFDSDWNPQMDLQAQDRCHRIGQTKRVLVYRLVTEHSVDHVIVQRAEAKRKLERVVLQDGRFDASHRALTRKVLDLGEIRAILEEQEQQHVRLREMKKEGEDLVNDKMLEALLDRDTIFAMSQEEEQCTGLANDSPKLNDKENGTEDPRIKRNSALNEECEIKHGGKRRKTSGNLKNNGKENIEKQQVNSSQESVVQGHKFFQLVSVEGNVHSQKIKEEY
ncbi:lymphoid-specific helicase-like isoform X2 [Symsagittifera roscoffensis]|uniref:lymphoid-specific helicase-like isoform X2 n=1 Tax=Symsagittifera roscoffensis TaxID=84072 RepID=UPI00307B44E8